MATLKPQPCANEWVYLFVSWHSDSFPGLCTWPSPPGFLNSLSTKPNLYVGSIEATGTVCGQTDKWGEALSGVISPDSEPPPRATPGLRPACQTHYKEQAYGWQVPVFVGYAMLVKWCCTGLWFVLKATCECLNRATLAAGRREEKVCTWPGSPYIAGLELLGSSMSLKALQLHQNCSDGFKEPSCKGQECLPGCSLAGLKLFSNPFPPPHFTSLFSQRFLPLGV